MFSLSVLQIQIPDGREKAAQEAGATSSYDDYNEMQIEEGLDIVSVCPRWGTERLDMVLACLNNGCHVYCEIPMTMTLADGDQIVQTAKANNLKVAVAHQAVYLPRLHQLKQLIENGKIIAAIPEERLNREKKSRVFPIPSLGRWRPRPRVAASSRRQSWPPWPSSWPK